MCPCVCHRQRKRVNQLESALGRMLDVYAEMEEAEIECPFSLVLRVADAVKIAREVMGRAG